MDDQIFNTDPQNFEPYSNMGHNAQVNSNEQGYLKALKTKWIKYQTHTRMAPLRLADLRGPINLAKRREIAKGKQPSPNYRGL